MSNFSASQTASMIMLALLGLGYLALVVIDTKYPKAKIGGVRFFVGFCAVMTIFWIFGAFE